MQHMSCNAPSPPSGGSGQAAVQGTGLEGDLANDPKQRAEPPLPLGAIQGVGEVRPHIAKEHHPRVSTLGYSGT